MGTDLPIGPVCGPKGVPQPEKGAISQMTVNVDPEYVLAATVSMLVQKLAGPKFCWKS